MALNDMRTLALEGRSDEPQHHEGRRVPRRRTRRSRACNTSACPSHPLHELASRYLWLVDAEHDELYGKPVNRYGHLMSFCVKGGARSRAHDLRRAAAHLARHRPGPHQERGHDPRHLHPPAAGRGRPQAGPHPAEHGPPLRRRRAPRRHHRRPGSGPEGSEVAALNAGRSVRHLPFISGELKTDPGTCRPGQRGFAD